ncbi:YaiI/YqxD family protein [Lentisphaerota bacterium WC36G]|nr:YaiI/YqxD family protein [Lentisphaerae bacterium WC36]
MKIYVDADACPKAIKEVLYKVAERKKIELILVADQYFKVPYSQYIQFIRVKSNLDAADNKIAELVEVNDIVITADIPLADKAVTKKAFALNPRGELYTERNIKERLAIRDMMQEFRDNGMETGGPPPFNDRNRQNFTNQLNSLICKLTK